MINLHRHFRQNIIYLYRHFMNNSMKCVIFAAQNDF